MERRTPEPIKDSARDFTRGVLINVLANLVAAAIILVGAAVVRQVPAARVMDLPVHTAGYVTSHARILGVFWTTLIGDRGSPTSRG